MKQWFSKQEWAYIFYDWAESAHTVMIATIVLQLLYTSMTANAGMDEPTSMAIYGYITSAIGIVVAILAPVLGTMADYEGMKLKMFRIFFYIGIAATALLTFFPADNWQVLMLLYAGSTFGYTGANIFYDAFIVDVTDHERMDLVSTAGYAFGYIGGSTIPLVLSILLLTQHDVIGISITMAFRISFLMTAVWWYVFSLPFLHHVKQTEGRTPKVSILKESIGQLAETIKEISKYKQIFIFLFAYFLYIDGVGTIMKMATVFATSLGLGSNDLLLVMLAIQIIGFPFALLYGYASKKIDTKYLLFIAIAVYTIVCIYAFFMKTATDFWILGLLVATSQGGIQSLSRSYFGKMIPKEKANEFFGFYNILGRFATVVGPALVGMMGAMFQDVRMGVFSLIFLFLAGAILLYYQTTISRSA